MRGSDPHHTPRLIRILAAVAALTALVAGSACSSADDQSRGGGPPAQQAVDGVPVDDPLDPDAYAAFLAENPDVPLVNVHVPYEGYIPGTDAFVAFDQILDWEDLPADPSDPIALYCRSGNMSRTASEQLAAAGYTNVVDLAGGMQAWGEAGYDLREDGPTESS